uniref:Integrase, catalytic region, zinc finger, CCHC-type, peptidase aspartic, catalytic n=1 Tax=Tanacetum cinerariifolium TaxID=118510 RepID=A0A6L2LL30_TANCI|nr:hypothetical protein [Tanacetum cinerariifolium]
MEQFQVNTKFLNSLPPKWSPSVLVFSPRDDLIACLNKAMAFLIAVASSRNVAWYKDKEMLAEAQEAGQSLDEEQLTFLADPGVPDAVLMANISNYGSDVISEVPHFETYLNDMENQRLKCSTSNCGLNPTVNKKNDRISQTPSRNMKNKVEAQPRNVNKKNRVVKPILDVNVKQLQLNVNSELTCATSMLNLLRNIKNKKIKKPTGLVFTEVGLKWKPTGRTFTIFGNSCLLTRISSANVVPPSKPTSHLVETQKPEHKVYSRKPKNVKNVGSSKKANIVESKNANHSEHKNAWGSNATDIPSSSSLVMIGCQDCSLVSGLWMFKTYDREPLSAHELCFKESPNTPIFLDDALHEDLTSQRSSSNVRQTHTLFEHLGRWNKDHPIANMMSDPSFFISIRKQLQTDVMWCYFDAFLTSVEPKNFKQAMTEPSWIDALQEEIYEFERLQVWELVSCPDKIMLIKLKLIYKVKTDEFSGILKNKARLVA